MDECILYRALHVYTAATVTVTELYGYSVTMLQVVHHCSQHVLDDCQ